MRAAETESVAPELTPVALFLSGRRRGQIEKLDQKTLRVVKGADAEIGFLAPDDESAGDYHATLHRAGTTYEIAVAPERNVWVNGHRLDKSHVAPAAQYSRFPHL